MLTYALWFFSGVLAHKFFSYLMNIRYSRKVFDNTVDSLLLVIDALSSDVEFALKLKQNHLMHTNLTNKILDKCIESDKKILLQWKDTIISKMAATSLRSYSSLIRYYKWSDAKQRVEELKRKRGT